MSGQFKMSRDSPLKLTSQSLSRLGFVSSIGFRSVHTRVGSPTTCRTRSWVQLSVSGSASMDMSSMLRPTPRVARPPRGSFVGVFFTLVTYLYALPLFLLAVVMHPIVRLLDGKRRRFHDLLANIWLRLTMITCLQFPIVRGRENLPGPGSNCIFVANHASFLDIYMLSWLGRSLKYVSKARNFQIPIVGWAMTLQKNISLPEGSRKGQVQCYRSILDTLGSGNNLVLFPEGTRSRDGRLLKFQSGAFRAATETGLPVVPITILGTYEVYPSGSFVPICSPKQRMELQIHPSIDPKGKSDKDISRLAFAAINSALPPHRRSESTPETNT